MGTWTATTHHTIRRITILGGQDTHADGDIDDVFVEGCLTGSVAPSNQIPACEDSPDAESEEISYHPAVDTHLPNEGVHALQRISSGTIGSP